MLKPDLRFILGAVLAMFGDGGSFSCVWVNDPPCPVS